jgi:hypothetical protein
MDAQHDQRNCASLTVCYVATCPTLCASTQHEQLVEVEVEVAISF